MCMKIKCFCFGPLSVKAALAESFAEAQFSQSLGFTTLLSIISRPPGDPYGETWLILVIEYVHNGCKNICIKHSRVLWLPCKVFVSLIREVQRAASPFGAVEKHLHGQVSIQILLEHLHLSQFDYIVLYLCAVCAIRS